MAWDQLWIDNAHVAYALIGGFVTVFSLISLFVKEKLYIGEATVATIFGLIVGPHCLNWFAPTTWGNSDYITIEVSRIVLVVQIFAVAVELPKKYMLKHWLSVTILLIPVMTFGWMLTSVFVWKLVPTLKWVEALAIAACVTATDPVLASAVVGKGKFAKRVPGHLRNLLSAESGCNDGMAFPFAYLGIALINYKGHHGEIAFHFIVLTILYECIFGCVLGAIIGYSGRHLIKFAEKKNLIDRESFLVFYFVLALFCTGVGSIIGTDDLLVAFSAGAAFAWDGWFARKTEESDVSNVIDLLLNMSFFVYFGAIVPWDQFNSAALGISAWKLTILAILVLLFRRIPIVMAMKPLIPDIRTWREALFCGHFGPVGVGAVFISILVRAELEHGEPTPLKELPSPGTPNYYPVATIWPISCFLIIASIIVHGSSIAVFTLGKRINNMTLTMTYTTGGNNQSWLSRLPRAESGRVLSFHKMETDDGFIQKKLGNKKKKQTAKPAGGMKKRKRSKKVGGDRERPEVMPIDLGAGRTVPDSVIRRPGEQIAEESINNGGATFVEGDNVIVENSQGEVVHQTKIDGDEEDATHPSKSSEESTTGSSETMNNKPAPVRTRSKSPRKSSDDQTTVGRRTSHAGHTHGGHRITAYQIGDHIIVENDEGEIIQRYRVNRHNAPGAVARRGSITQSLQSGLDKTLSLVGLGSKKGDEEQVGGPSEHDPEKNLSDAAPELVPEGGPKDQQGVIDEDVMKKRLKDLLLKPTGSKEGQEVKTEVPAVNSDVKQRLERDENLKQKRLELTGKAHFLGQRDDEEEEDEDDDDDEEEDESEEGDEDDDDGEETEVERRRRLAALGLIDDADDDDDDDDETDTRRVHHARVPSAIAEEEEDEGESTRHNPGVSWGGVRRN